MFDYHIHTKSSADSSAEPMEMLRAAKAAGLSEICLTNHADINHKLPPDFFPFDMDEIERDFLAVKDNDLGVDVKNGIEIGVDASTAAEYEELLKDRSFDFVICSQHFIDGMDPYDGEYFRGKTQKEAYEGYLTANLNTIKIFKNYSVIGHIGYPAKYWRDGDGIMNMKKYGDIIEQILKTAVQDGKGIEVNTSGIGNTGEPMAAYDVVKAFLELGGEIITIGSDAHDPSQIARHFDETAERLKYVGVKYLCTFENMVPSFWAI